MRIHPLAPTGNGSPRARSRRGAVSEASSRQFWETFDQVPVGIAHTRAGDGAWIRVNRTLCDLLGYTSQELLQHTFRDITHPDDLEDDLCQLERLLAGEISSYKLQKRYIRKDGAQVWARVSIGLGGPEGDGEPYVIAIVEDITEMFEAEAALRESEERYRSLVELCPDSIMVFAGGSVAYANASAAALFGAESPSQLIGINAQLLIQAGHLPSVTEVVTAARRTGRGVEIGDGDLVRIDGVPIAANLEVSAAGITYRGEQATQLVVRDRSERRQAEEALRQSERGFRLLFSNNPLPMWVYDAETLRFLEVNESAIVKYGYSRDEFLSMTLIDIRPDGDVPRLMSILKTGHPGNHTMHTWRHRKKNGDVIEVEIVSHQLKFASRDAVLVLAQDVTERKRSEEALRESEARYRALVETSPDGITLTDLDGRVLMANQVAATLRGLQDPSEMIGRDILEFVPPDERAEARAVRASLLEDGHVGDVEHRYRQRDGSILSVDVSSAVIRDDQGVAQGIINVARDISDRKQFEQTLTHQASHDGLTGLPNRDQLRRRLEAALEQDSAGPLAFLLMDLDRFKEINDTFGHHYGDLLLAELGPRLRSVFADEALVARLGGDEFGIMLPRASREDAAEAARRLLGLLSEPMVLESRTLDVGGSIGIVLAPDHGGDVNELLRRADVAMYLAKRDRRGFDFYDPERDQHSSERLMLMADLRGAIENNQLVLHYQPKASLRTGEIRSTEALVRWEHPERGLIPPNEFIPLAEHGGLITPLSYWVIESALQQVRKWRESGRDITVAVNLSPRNLHNQDLVPTLEALLKKWRIEPQVLKLELTESAIMDHPDAAMETLTRLHNMGVRISIDDFGTGYSSLGYLKRLPVDEIKIDRSFVTDMVEQKDDAFIVRSIIDLGHNLNIQVVAEGVENQRTWDLLSVLGCDVAQGYFLSRPLPAPDVTLMLKRTNKFLIQP